MSASERPWRAWWLWAMPAAWAASALLIFAESGWLPFLVCFGGLCLAWKCCPSTLRRRAVVSLVVLALPIQGFAGVAMELRGHPHFHAHDAAQSHHGHAHVERHFHAAGESMVEVDDHDAARHHAALAAGEDKRAVFASLDTLTTASLGFLPQSLPGAIPAAQAVKRAGHIPHGPERPPSSSTIS